MRRRTARAAALATAALALTGCTTVINGHPVAEPSTNRAASIGQLSAEPDGGCLRSATPATCQEWTDTEPATGQALLEQWARDQTISAQMLCSALPGDTWEKYLGPKNYRYIDDSTSCTASSQDNQLVIRLALYGAAPLADYLATRGSTETITIAGVPARRTTATDATDGIGEDSEDLILAPTGDQNAPGVLHVQLVLRPPRGHPSTAPVDRTRLSIRDTVVTDLLAVLFP